MSERELRNDRVNKARSLRNKALIDNNGNLLVSASFKRYIMLNTDMGLCDILNRKSEFTQIELEREDILRTLKLCEQNELKINLNLSSVRSNRRTEVLYSLVSEMDTLGDRDFLDICRKHRAMFDLSECAVHCLQDIKKRVLSIGDKYGKSNIIDTLRLSYPNRPLDCDRLYSLPIGDFDNFYRGECNKRLATLPNSFSKDGINFITSKYLGGSQEKHKFYRTSIRCGSINPHLVTSCLSTLDGVLVNGKLIYQLGLNYFDDIDEYKTNRDLCKAVDIITFYRDVVCTKGLDGVKLMCNISTVEDINNIYGNVIADRAKVHEFKFVNQTWRSALPEISHMSRVRKELSRKDRDSIYNIANGLKQKLKNVKQTEQSIRREIISSTVQNISSEWFLHMLDVEHELMSYVNNAEAKFIFCLLMRKIADNDSIDVKLINC